MPDQQVFPKRAPRRASRQASLGFILAAIALDALAFALFIPVLPAQLVQVGGLKPNETSFWLGIIFSVFACMQFLGAPVAGGLSDRFGRRPVLLVSLAAMGLNSLLWCVVPNLFWLLVLRVIAGALAGNITAATAYIADVTPPAERSRAFGLVGAMFGLGFVVGPAIGGALGEISVRLPFLVSAALLTANVLYGVFVLPESLPPEKRRAFSWRRANPVGALRLFGSEAGNLRIGIAWCCSWLAIGAQQSCFILVLQIRFGWSIGRTGLALALGGIAQAFVQGVLVGRVNAAIGARRTAMLGFGCAATGYGVYAAADTPALMLAGIVVLACGALANPSVQSMLANQAGPTRQGEVQGALGSLQGLSLVVGPTLTGLVLDLATRPNGAWHWPGAPFALAASVCVLALFSIATGPKTGVARP